MALPVNGSTHLISAYYSIYWPRKDERLSWDSWLTYSGRFTHISGHPSAAGWAQDRESSPARDRRSTTVPRHQLKKLLAISKFCITHQSTNCIKVVTGWPTFTGIISNKLTLCLQIIDEQDPQSLALKVICLGWLVPIKYDAESKRKI